MRVLFSMALVALVTASVSHADEVQVPLTITTKTLVSDVTHRISFSDGVFMADDGDVVKVICSREALLKRPQMWVLIEGTDNRILSRYDEYGRKADVFKMEMLEEACEAQVSLISEALNSGQSVLMVTKGYEKNSITIEFK